MNRIRIRSLMLVSIAGLALAMPAAVQAQAYGPDDAVTGGEDQTAPERSASGSGRNRQQTQRLQVQPYIEVSQVALAELSPGDDVVTYTQLAAGVDASVQGRNNGGSVSLRYERNIGYGDAALDSDTVTGVARGYVSIVPQSLTLEAGALAARTQVDNGGGSRLNAIEGNGSDSESRVYSAYVGPNFVTRAGDADISASYRFGYTRVEAPNSLTVTPGAPPVDVFDDSTVHSANARIGVRPDVVVPVGVGIGGGIYQEDVSNLDQRVRDAYVRGDVTVPVSRTVQLVGGVGFEDVEVSSRDAVFDPVTGLPQLDGGGRFVTDSSAPRQIAFDTEGLIWDVGVMWRPSSRTALEAHYGRRYDSDTYYGSFAYAPDSRSSINISVYDGVTGFGGALNKALVALPTTFEANRNAVTGDINGCVGSLQSGSCFGGALASVRSSVFRNRGGVASYSQTMGRYSAGIGIGYDRRTFVAAPGTVLAVADGLSEESLYASVFASGQVGQRGFFTVNAYGNYLTSDFTDGSAWVFGTSASYNQQIYAGLSARAAVSLDYLDSDVSGEDIRTAAALVGLRYDF